MPNINTIKTALDAAAIHGIKGLLPEGAVGFIREISRMTLSVRFGEI